MAGSKEGGRKAAETNKLKYGPDFYHKVGAQGGRNGRTGGFASEKVDANGLTGHDRAEKFGAIGGSKSIRGRNK